MSDTSRFHSRCSEFHAGGRRLFSERSRLHGGGTRRVSDGDQFHSLCDEFCFECNSAVREWNPFRFDSNRMMRDARTTVEVESTLPASICSVARWNAATGRGASVLRPEVGFGQDCRHCCGVRWGWAPCIVDSVREGGPLSLYRAECVNA